MKSYKEFLTEFTKFPKVFADKYGQFAVQAAKNREARTKAQTTYEDDKRYNDHEGRLWLNVKQKDKTTIYTAVLTGMIDSNRYGMEQIQIDSLNDLATLKDVLARVPRARALAEEVWDFLSQYMGKGTVHVYRGLDLSNKIYYLLAMDRRILYSPERILKYVDNTTKEFNSFSVDKSISNNFAKNFDKESIASLLYSADVDNNDINWAFTAYLFGRHGSIGELELNVNNLKKLKNVKIEAINIDKAIEQKAAIDRTAKFNERYPYMKCSVGKELVKGKYEVINIENNLKNITDNDCNLLCKNWFKKIVLRTTNDTYEQYYEIVNAEDKLNIFDSDLRPMLNDWYYSVVRLRDSDFALVSNSPDFANGVENKYNIVNLRTREKVVPEDFAYLSSSTYMNNHSYAVVAVEIGHKCVIDLHTGKYMTDAIYNDVEIYKTGFVMHRTDDKYDIFDSNCKIIVDKLDLKVAYSYNLIKVRKNDMINVINMATGKLIIPKWIPTRAQMEIVTPQDLIGTFNHQKPGIYINQQKLDNFGNIASIEHIYIDFDGKAQISEENPFED